MGVRNDDTGFHKGLPSGRRLAEKPAIEMLSRHSGRPLVMKKELFDRARQDPAAVFDAPEDVISEDGLSNEQKIEVLRRWEYNASEGAVALEEGMPGEESDLLRRILVAIGKLTGPLDLERTGPSKQHGLGRDAIKKST
jgi:hypothetical protein